MFPVSIKGVLLLPSEEVVLALNSRHEWELPGGRIEVGEDPEYCLAREFREECSVDVDVKVIIDTYLFEVIPARHVFIATYGCHLSGKFKPLVSHEHQRIATFAIDELPENLPAGYVKSIRTWRSILADQVRHGCVP
ncbi:NUDIX hydrolase [Microbulbifer halophilus]|uniref:NUDIX domain-containing protein n=1 Tax=Microbulbifer halophilus TaxID=453963 RepID=A0ABW5E9J5_9GAMM|nr:NUDIX domain-containing protein [Microbulbifer halophilus]MCW8128085.1 NUDIX domain-containing protein [Microbulbifer halophilus]